MVDLWEPQSWALVSEMQHVPPICTCCVFWFDVKKKVSVKASGRRPCVGSLWKKGSFGNHTVKVATTATVYVCASGACLSLSPPSQSVLSPIQPTSPKLSYLETGSAAGALSNMLALNCKRKRLRLT